MIGGGTLNEPSTGKLGLVLVTASAPGVLHQLTGVIARHNGDIRSISIIEEQLPDARIYFEVDVPGPSEPLLMDLQQLEVVRSVTAVQSLQKIYGKRIIIVEAELQVGQVALERSRKLTGTTYAANISRWIRFRW